MCYIGVSNNFGMRGAELREQVERVKYWVEVANAMGVPMVRVFGGWVPDDEEEESVWPRLIAATREVTAYARSRGDRTRPAQSQSRVHTCNWLGRC